MPSHGQLRAFSYVTAEKAPLYRAIMRTFARAKARFLLHLRPDEVLASMRADSGGGIDNLVDIDADAALAQLCEWGNLERHPDTAEVATVEEFYRPRYLFQLSAEGEAAERAIEHYEERLARPGELQTLALTDIRTLLGELRELANTAEIDAAKAHRALRMLRERFDDLTSRAQAFMGSLQRTIDLHGYAEEQFMEYKRLLIDYLERFIGELVIATADIAHVLVELDETRINPLLKLAAERDLADAVVVDDEARREAEHRWRERWSGLRSWFIGSADHPPQSEVLRARARSAIRALLGAIAGINDRRATRSDRVADLRALARWFAEAADDDSAHRLWRAAFGLTSARHLRVDAATVTEWDAQNVNAATSWLDAPPLQIAPRLRATGRSTRRGHPSNVVDRSADKERILRQTELEARQIEAARRRLATDRPLRLSELAELDETEFGLLLDLLGEALSRLLRTGVSVEAQSTDGTLIITLERVAGGGDATIKTVAGTLSGPDCFVHIRDAFARRRPDAAAAMPDGIAEVRP